MQKVKMMPSDLLIYKELEMYSTVNYGYFNIPACIPTPHT